ncbi:MAG TPA: DUF6476 family protein [Stellaceae bacterium]|jgi:hypothetical protein|nr:DUF6476 family protein [Stellaceae bacterium]
MAALKVLVVVMGIMLVAGVAVLLAAIAARVSHKGSDAGAPQPFAAVPIDIPPGARVEAMSAGPDRLVLDLVLADGTRALVVIDLTTGHRLGTIPLRAAP